MLTKRWDNWEWLLLLILVTLLALVQASCTRTIYVPETRTETEYIDRLRVDSLYLHDSIFVSEKQKGDTIYVTEYKYKVVDRLNIRVDSVCVVDSIPYPVEVPKVEYRTPAIMKWLAAIGILAIILVIVRLWVRFATR